MVHQFLHRKVVLFSWYFWFLLSKLMQTLFWVFTKVFMRYYSSKAMTSACFSDSSKNHQTKPKTETGANITESSELKSANFGAITDTSSHEGSQIDSQGSEPEAEAGSMEECSNYSSKSMNSARSSFSSHEIHQTKPETEAGACFSESSEDDDSLKYESFGSDSGSVWHESSQIDCNSSQIEAEAGSMKEWSEAVVDGNGIFGLEEEETSKLVFKFQYQSWNCNLDEEETKDNDGESCDLVKRETVSAITNNKYQFFSGYSFSHILDQPEASNFAVKEFFVHPNDDFPLKNQVSEGSTEKVHTEEELNDVISAEQQQQPLASVSRENLLSEDDDFVCSSIDSDSIGPIGDGFLSDADFGATIDPDSLGNHDDEENGGLTDEAFDFDDLDLGYEPDDFAEEDEEIMDELRKLEEDCRVEDSSIAGKKKSLGNSKSFEDSSVNAKSESLMPFEGEDSNRFDTLWEHQDLIEQLKMELKKVRATGLPTILEDSESPRIMEDLKPWNIDEKFQHGGGNTTNELPKFYRSYRERMRKFDILNYQKMYAIGLLESKEPLKALSRVKKQRGVEGGLTMCRGKSSEAGEAMRKFARELYCDLETVYVGHLCLSWEFLQWEYDKSLELWETDQYGFRTFNEVAGEFQHFQVLLHRFIENESFQGPRVLNYNTNRCAMRTLLQVPLIREDSAKDKKKLRQSEADEDAIITSETLVEILEESIRTIWRFIKADKDASSLALKGGGARETQVELQDPADSELLVQIRTDLQKKEKRLRELLRSGRCILKKLKNHDEDGTDQVLYFFSQVDMKLVWRVLNMSRITTEQLAWCRSKLNKISFVNRRIHVEPSFLLFPS